MFTQEKFAGNPLAVCLIPAGEDVTTEAMQAVAREFNLSETLFIYEVGPQDGEPSWRVRIFLTNAEIPFAGKNRRSILYGDSQIRRNADFGQGHPTIGAACYALGTLQKANKGRFLAGAGPIELAFDGVAAQASIPHNIHVHTQYPFSAEEVYASQQSLQGLLTSGDAVTVVSPVKGMNFGQSPPLQGGFIPNRYLHSKHNVKLTIYFCALSRSRAP